MVIGDMGIASESKMAAVAVGKAAGKVVSFAKGMVGKVKSAAGSVIGKKWDTDSLKRDDGVECVPLDIATIWKGSGTPASDGVQGCDNNFWHKPHTSYGGRSELEWGVVDEAVFVNQPVGDGGRLVPTVDAGVQMYGGTICGTSSPSEKAGETRCFQYAMPLSFVSPNSAEDEECPCATPGTFPFFNCKKNAKQFYLHVSTMPGSRGKAKNAGKACKSLSVDPGVLYFYQKSLTAKFESKKTDVNVRSCPSTDIMT